MVYIAMIAERTSHPLPEVIELFLGIYKMFPEYKEPLYYAATAATESSQHDKAITLLEKFYYSETRAEFCDKHIISDKEVPKMLCSYYFKTNLKKCIPFLYHHYIERELEFDYTYESYLRYIFRMNPRAPHPSKWVVFSDNLLPENFSIAIPLQNATVFDESQEDQFRMIVTSYAIENILILNRVDRIPFFPNIENIFLLLTKDTPQGGSLECFPTLRAVICKTQEHVDKIRDEYFSSSARKLLITLDQFLSVTV
jgi:hypothetical protein